MDRPYKISKLKLNDKLEISYTKKDATYFSEHSAKFEEPARPELEQALKNLTIPMLYELELPETMAARFKPYGVTFKFNQSKEICAIISAKLLCRTKKETTINTPPLKAKDMTESMLKAICGVYNEGIRYLQGERAQGNLFAWANEESMIESPSGKVLHFPTH